MGPPPRFSRFGLPRMTSEKDAPPPRKPRVFKADDIVAEPDADEAIDTAGAAAPRRLHTPVPPRRLTASDINRGFRFGSILFSAMAVLPSIAPGLWFARFFSIFV